MTRVSRPFSPTAYPGGEKGLEVGFNHKWPMISSGLWKETSMKTPMNGLGELPGW